ncbi:HHL1-like protein [Candidatus Cyanaurora vandensis]|uniref:HHL1-like protein n=1 Tax=Candidatus Cyanaurora vandensis TaxID=2714958 RepID=UPI002579A460|nr:HHL1-like protein [Candidatus Cyanaurora vandensis]
MSKENFKGFGKPPQPQTPAKKKTNDYGKQDLDQFVAEKGGQTYSLFIRADLKGGWFPAGTIASPAERIDEAVDDSKKTLNSYVLKRFPKLRGQEANFEYGYRATDKPRDPVTVAKPFKRSWLDRVKSFFKRK